MAASPDPVLTILIPTRDRAQRLREALDAFGAIVSESGTQDLVEIVCVDNFSSDETAEVVRAASARYPFVRYEHHTAPRATAEESLAAAVGTARGEFVWAFGDDDIPLAGCVPSLLRTLQDDGPDFLLLNMRILLGDESGPEGAVDYFTATPTYVPFRDGLALFRQFGLVSATTTMSCLCFRRRSYDAAAAIEWAGISPVYSHTASLLSMYHDRPAGFLSTPMLLYRQNSVAEESERFAGWSVQRGRPMEWIFTAGLVGLLRRLNERVGISLCELAHFEEVEIRKGSWDVRHGLLWAFMYRFALARMRQTMSQGSGSGLEADAEIVRSVVRFLYDAGDPELAGPARLLARTRALMVASMRAGGDQGIVQRQAALQAAGQALSLSEELERRHFEAKRANAPDSGLLDFDFGPSSGKVVLYE